jgi:hypothetical protein
MNMRTRLAARCPDNPHHLSDLLQALDQPFPNLGIDFTEADRETGSADAKNVPDFVDVLELRKRSVAQVLIDESTIYFANVPLGSAFYDLGQTINGNVLEAMWGLDYFALILRRLL